MATVDRWLLPDGIEEVLPPEAARIEIARRQVLDLFQSWGYELVVTPHIEYLESLLTGAGQDLDQRTFKVVDPQSGRLMGFRADFTPQVARIDAHTLRREGPSRLCYAGSVLQAIGLKVPSVRANAAPTEFVSLEQLLALDPGWLLVGHYRRPSIVDSWSKQPLWQVLGAVRNKQVAEVDGDSWARNRGVLASEQIAEDALAILKGGKAVLSQ